MMSIKVLLLVLLIQLSYQTAQKCDQGAYSTLLSNEDRFLDLDSLDALILGSGSDCKDMDKCQLDCSTFVAGCSKKLVIGIKLNSAYGADTFNYVCRKDIFKKVPNNWYDQIDRKVDELMIQLNSKLEWKSK